MTIASRVGVHLPDELLVRLISLAYRRYEPETRHLDEVCGRGGTMLDIGGWYGPWTRRMARRADKVVAIEPTPLHAILRRTAPSNVEVIAAAASDHAGEAEIWLGPSGVGAEGVSSLHRRDVHGVSMKVALITVDELALDDVSFMKIDVDGHEVPVLLGAMETIKRWRPRLFIEVEERIQPVSALNGLLESVDYRGWVLPGRQWMPLSGFDLVAHQARTCHVAERGLARRTLWPYPRYVNSVLYLPGGQTPDMAHRQRGPGQRSGLRPAPPASARLIGAPHAKDL
jgi:FkbM family methyltransferase